jgi:hypothetical protein
LRYLVANSNPAPDPSPSTADRACSTAPPPPPHDYTSATATASSTSTAHAAAAAADARAADAGERIKAHLRRPRGGVRRLLSSLLRVADLQYRIWLTHAKMTLMRMALYAGLFLVAAVLGLLAIIFLYIGAFRVLTDVLHLAPVWAYLIFGGLHLVLAVALVLIGTSVLGKNDDKDEKKDKQDASHHHASKRDTKQGAAA